MEGKIINYNPDTRTGSIQSNEGNRYIFSADDYRSPDEITVGQSVDFDFDTNNNRVVDVYALQGTYSNVGNTVREIGSNLPQSGQVISQQVMEASKEAVSDTLTVFQSIQQDPANGLQSALNKLGDDRALNAGIILCVLFVLSCWAATVKAITVIATLFGAFSHIFSGGSSSPTINFGLSEHIRILVSSAVPALGIVLVLLAIQKFFKGAGNYKQFTFATGICLFPITLLLFILWLLGFSSGEFVLLLTIFCFSTLILLLNSTMIGVLQLSARNAFLLVPIVLVVDTFIIRIVSSILY
jgi:hypothetical protein